MIVITNKSFPNVSCVTGKKYFLHRIKSATDVRVVELHAVPLGGHVEEFDRKHDQDLIQTALERELQEETIIKAKIISRKFEGLIYLEDENAGNQYHIGVTYLFDLDSDQVELRESKLEKLGWVDRKFLTGHYDELSYWSQVYISYLFKLKTNQKKDG